VVLSYSALQYPQLEGQLKLLYTGVTRCCNRLVFTETKKSDAGASFFRWLTKGSTDKKIAEELVPTTRKITTKTGNESEIKEEAEEVELMTNDEWRARGVDLAMMAEDASEAEVVGVPSVNSSSASLQYLRKALQCFDRAGDATLRARAETQLQVLALVEKLQTMEDDQFNGDNSVMLVEQKSHDSNESDHLKSRCSVIS
jgi:hypothetical protein